MKNPLVSILLRNYNEIHAIKKTLRMFSKQKYTNWELIACDCGSRDGSAEVLEKFKPAVFLKKCANNYRPGDVLNAMVHAAKGKIIVFNNADCIPVGRNWLCNIVFSLVNKGCKKRGCVVFVRQIGHNSMRISLQRDLLRAYGNGENNKNWFHFFSLASSATWRETVLKYPFSSKYLYCEDVEWSYRLRQVFGANFVNYVSSSKVLHNHDYSNKSLAVRSLAEGFWLADIFPNKFFVMYLLKFIPSFFFHVLADYYFLLKKNPTSFKKYICIDPFVYRFISKCCFALGIIKKWLHF